LKELHEGICDRHIGFRALANQAIRAGFYWLTILYDATDLARRCGRCQRYALISC